MMDVPDSIFENVGSRRPQNLNDEGEYSKEEVKVDEL